MPGRATIETRKPATSAGLHHLRAIEAGAVIPDRRIGRAGEQRRDADVVRPRLGGEHARDAELAHLRRGVAGALGERLMRRMRADHHDVAASGAAASGAAPRART